MKLSLEDIQKCFIYFDHLGFKRPGDSPLFEEFTEFEWLEIFKDIPQDKFIQAYKIAAKNIRFFPKPIDIFEAIEEIKQINQPQYKQLPPAQPKQDISQERIKKLMAAVYSGQAQKWLKDNVDPQVINYAKELYPDMSEELIIHNYGQFSWLLESSKMSGKFRREPFLDKETGYVEIRVIA